MPEMDDIMMSEDAVNFTDYMNIIEYNSAHHLTSTALVLIVALFVKYL